MSAVRRSQIVPLTVLGVSAAILVGTLAWSVAVPGYTRWDYSRSHSQQMMSPSQMGAIGAIVRGMGPVETINEAIASADRLAATWGLGIGEVMEFGNHFYVELVDQGGRSATEVIVERATGDVHLEWGPAMMWNTAYGMMPTDARLARSAIDAQSARTVAEKWLEQFRPELRTGQVHAFPGYYTFHTMRDGAIAGMLSVHSRSGQVWYHTWHGEFIRSGGHPE